MLVETSTSKESVRPQQGGGDAGRPPAACQTPTCTNPLSPQTLRKQHRAGSGGHSNPGHGSGVTLRPSEVMLDRVLIVSLLFYFFFFPLNGLR